ncbi:hypothetical protein EHS25_000875 [Saitozyma podzolica]|uniref:Uncharacterized protein n=1 Tax=Saitozyma podzolica TaxID=1890683 RepID=A0A427YXH2_9TREE|nr:hypothetical protein EHS25_000875 [Saitozyma podzolica]
MTEQDRAEAASWKIERAQVIPLGIKHVTKVIPPLVNRGQQPPSSPAIFPTYLAPALHIHTDNPALFPAYHTARSSRLASNTPQTSSLLASQTRSQLYVDHGYGGDGMDLDAMPNEASQDGSGRSDGGSVWSPSVQSEASVTPTSPSSPSTAPPSPTRPSPTPSSPPPSSPTPLSPALLAVLEEEPFHVNDPSGSSPPPSQDVRDQPFMDAFKLLMDLDNGDDILADLPQPIDDSLADIQLINRAPLRRLHMTYHRGPAFDRYLLLAEATHQLWVDLRYKQPFFDELIRYHIAQPGRLNFQASLGKVHLPTSVFIHCLTAAGCDTIRLKAYGQKMPMTENFLHTEPAQTDHRWAEHNEWDIETSFASPTSGSLPRQPGDTTASSISPCWSQALVIMVWSTCGRLTVSSTRRDPENTAGWKGEHHLVEGERVVALLGGLHNVGLVLKSSAQDLEIVPEDPAERALEPNVRTESRGRNEVEAKTTNEHDVSQGDLLPLVEKGGRTDRGCLERAITSSGDPNS